MTEAAQVNLGGLECSAYAWQVRHVHNVSFGADCQGYSDPARHRPNLRMQSYTLYINVLSINFAACDNRRPPKNGCE